MAHLNEVRLIGRLGADPEKRKTGKGTTVTNFFIATTKQWKDKESGEQLEKTQWHRVVAFNKHAENCAQYLRKGKLVLIKGELQTRSYEKGDQTHYPTEILLNGMQMLEPKSKDDKKSETKTQNGKNKKT